VVAEDEYQFDFRIMVPPFIPLGKWDIYLKLRNDQNVILGCIKGVYTVD